MEDGERIRASNETNIFFFSFQTQSWSEKSVTFSLKLVLSGLNVISDTGSRHTSWRAAVSLSVDYGETEGYVFH